MPHEVTALPACICGGPAHLKRSHTGLTWLVECKKCGKHTDSHCEKANAQKDWEKKRSTI